MEKINFKMNRLRLLFAISIVALITVGVQGKLNWGSMCAYCPLGFMQITLAGRSVPIDLLWPVLIVTLGVIFLGKAFCAWICPTAILRGIFQGENASKATPNSKCNGTCSTCSEIETKGSSYTTYIILGVVLLASLIVRFPVFCLVCPVGLFFGFGYAVFRLSTLYQPGWELIIFPTILILEVFVLRSWCTSFCPLGAMFKIVGQLGIKSRLAIRPSIDQNTCLQSQGHNCQICHNACPENLNMPLYKKDEYADCTLCLECYQDCPTEAIDVSIKSNVS